MEEKDISFIAVNCNILRNKNTFILDSGCTEHMVKEELETNMTKVTNLDKEIKIHIANGRTLRATKKGQLRGMCQGRVIKLEALIVPEMTTNLLSVGKLTKNGNKVIFSNSGVTITGEDYKLNCNEIKDHLYALDIKFDEETLHEYSNKVTIESKTDSTLWHRRLGHLNKVGLNILGLPYDKNKCTYCVEGKSTRQPFYIREKTFAKRIGDKIYSDV